MIDKLRPLDCGTDWVRKVSTNNLKNVRNQFFKLFISTAEVSCRKNVNKGDVELWFFDLLKAEKKALGLESDPHGGFKCKGSTLTIKAIANVPFTAHNVYIVNSDTHKTRNIKKTKLPPTQATINIDTEII